MERERIESIIKAINEAGVKAELDERTGEEAIALGDGPVKQAIKVNKLEAVMALKGIDDKSAVECLVEAYEKRADTREAMRCAEKNILNWEKTKDNVRLILRGSEENETIITRDFLDLKMIPVVKIELDDGSAMSKIKEPLLKKWGITEDELFETAMRNTKRHYIVRNMTDILEQLIDEDDRLPDFMKDIFKKELISRSGANQALMLTTADGFGGAAAMCVDGILAQLSMILETDIVICCLSTDEVVLHPYDKIMTAEDYKGVIEDCNESTAEWGKVLSNSVYIYRKDTDKIEIFA